MVDNYISIALKPLTGSFASIIFAFSYFIDSVFYNRKELDFEASFKEDPKSFGLFTFILIMLIAIILTMS